MTFLGIEFILFFFLVALFSYILPDRFRNLFLLLAGYFFYWTLQPDYLFLLITATVIDYFIALKMVQVKTSRKRGLLITGIIINVGLLIFFKYFNFFSNLFHSLSGAMGITYSLPVFDLVLPLGISYYLFKKISYLTDVYRENLEPEKNFTHLALYVSFFPEIIAGPIDRARNLLPQFLKKLKPQPGQLIEGAQLIGWGLFKKLIIADRLGILVNGVFNHPDQHAGGVILLAMLSYAFQIYCDFSGYSDIAIGLGRMLGIKLMDNFRQPYFATSVAQFWKRWHISLSLWLRDYLFLPISYSLMRKLDKNKRIKLKTDVWAYISGVLITMGICGLWHGAAWTFVVWGILHGVYLIVSFATKKVRKKAAGLFHLNKFPRIWKVYKISLTFIMVSFAWLFFRAGNMEKAFGLLGRIFASHNNIDLVSGSGRIGGLSAPNFWIAVIAVIILLLVEWGQEKSSLHKLLAKKPLLIRWVIYYFIIFSILIFGIYQQQEFIYGQF